MKWVKAAGTAAAAIATLFLLFVLMLIGAAAELSRYAEDTCPYGNGGE